MMIGIDLGTSNSCVAVFRNGKPEIIANDQGIRSAPSYVAFSDNGALIGEKAKIYAPRSPHNTIFSTKRLIGRTFYDQNVQDGLQKNRWPFRIIEMCYKPTVQVDFKSGDSKSFFPEEIVAMLLKKLKETAEAYLGGQTIIDVVITVPGFFNDRQRQATKDAATIAGLNARGLLNDRMAATYAYGFDKEELDSCLLVFDLGGASLKASIISMFEGIYEVNATAWDANLGGEDFDERVMRHFLTEFNKRHGKDISSDPRALSLLRSACEDAKRTLSTNPSTSIDIENLYGGIDFFSILSREVFEKLNEDLFDKITVPIEEAIGMANMNKNQIDEVVLIGGSTRIPRVKKILQDFFGCLKVKEGGLNPEEALACGAAIRSAILAGQSDHFSLWVMSTDIMSQALEYMAPCGPLQLLERNTELPRIHAHPFLISEDNADIATIEGDTRVNLFNIISGSGKELGAVPVMVIFSIDESGICSVEAEDDKGSRLKVTSKDETRLRRDKLKQLKKKLKTLDRDQAKNSLESLIMDVKSSLDNVKLDESVRTSILEKCTEVKSWLERNQSADKNDIENKKEELKGLCALKATKF